MSRVLGQSRIRDKMEMGSDPLLALVSQSPKDFDKVVFDLIGTKIVLHLEGEDAKIMSENLGVINKTDRDIRRELILKQPNLRALIRNNHYEPYAQLDIIAFLKKDSKKK